jgi:hypothetical protein
MIHQFAQTCEKFFKLCEESSFEKEKKNHSLYILLAELNYFCLQMNEIKAKYENQAESKKLQKIKRFTDNQVRPFISKNFSDLGFYWTTLNPNEIPNEPEFGTGDAIDDIVDIYADLKEGFAHYEYSNYDEAVFIWTFGYEAHWGQHLVELQAMLYDLIYRK